MAGTHETRKAKRSATLPEIPDKLYFRIGEVARLLDLPTYVLRFWESEFPQLKPAKGGTGQRLYRRRDVEALREIRRLLYDEGYTIPGARQFLKSRPPAGPKLELVPAPEETAPDRVRLRRLRAELHEIAGILSRPAAPARVSATSRSPARRRPATDGPPPLFAVPSRNCDEN